MKPRYFMIVLLCVSLTLSACNLPTSSAPNQNALSTAAALTVQAVLSPEATQAPATQSASTAATPTVTCTDSAKYTVWTRDNVTYDAKEVNKKLAPNTIFTMSWTLQNTGTCTWNSAYQMVFDSGTSLTTSANFPILPTGAVVAPGGIVNVSIPMTAPDKFGEYQSGFRLQDDHGKSVINFGVITNVGSASSQSLASPGDLRYEYDCTTGSVNVTLHWVDRASDEDGYRIYRDGAKLADIPADSTTYSDVAPTTGKYGYSVAAYNASGESSAGVKVTTSNCK